MTKTKQKVLSNLQLFSMKIVPLLLVVSLSITMIASDHFVFCLTGTNNASVEKLHNQHCSASNNESHENHDYNQNKTINTNESHTDCHNCYDLPLIEKSPSKPNTIVKRMLLSPILLSALPDVGFYRIKTTFLNNPREIPPGYLFIDPIKTVLRT